MIDHIMTDVCFPLQVWITQLCIEHLPPVLDLKSDSISTVVSSFLVALFFFSFSLYETLKSFHSRMRETNAEKRKCHRLKRHRQTVVMKRAKCVCAYKVYLKKNRKLHDLFKAALQPQLCDACLHVTPEPVIKHLSSSLVLLCCFVFRSFLCRPGAV